MQSLDLRFDLWEIGRNVMILLSIYRHFHYIITLIPWKFVNVNGISHWILYNLPELLQLNLFRSLLFKLIKEIWKARISDKKDSKIAKSLIIKIRLESTEGRLFEIAFHLLYSLNQLFDVKVILFLHVEKVKWEISENSEHLYN